MAKTISEKTTVGEITAGVFLGLTLFLVFWGIIAAIFIASVGDLVLRFFRSAQ